MDKLIEEINNLKKTDISKTINKRIKDFESFNRKNTKEWFSELCFCLLTANSKARTALAIQEELGTEGFCEYDKNKIRSCIIKNKHRFHNNKTKFIVQARKYVDIKDKLTGKTEFNAREWLVRNIKGLGYKEATHFLRNTGYKNLAILDRHILNLMGDYGIIKEKPKVLNKRKYLELEKSLKSFATRLKMSMAELDLYMWYIKTGEVLK